MKKKVPIPEKSGVKIPIPSLDDLVRQAWDLDASARHGRDQANDLAGRDACHVEEFLVDSFNRLLEKTQSAFPDPELLGISRAPKVIESRDFPVLTGQLVARLQVLKGFKEGDKALFEEFVAGLRELRVEGSKAFKETVEAHAGAWRRLASR